MSVRHYVLDSDVLIDAKQHHYSFDLCPGFWEALAWWNEKGRICSIDRVREELLRGDDRLSEWAKEAPEGFFATTTARDLQECYGRLMAHVMGSDYTEASKGNFARTADGWLVAFAMATGACVVTKEARDDKSKKVKIPNLCLKFSVAYDSPFRMLESLGTSFTWKPPSPSEP